MGNRNRPGLYVYPPAGARSYPMVIRSLRQIPPSPQYLQNCREELICLDKKTEYRSLWRTQTRIFHHMFQDRASSFRFYMFL